MDFEDQLAGAMRSSVATLRPHVPDLVAGGVARGRRIRRQRRMVQAGAAAAVLVLALGIGLGAAALRDGTTTSSTAATGSCRSVVSDSVLPSWARDGFSDARPAVPHVRSAHGDMLAILFGRELHSPPSADVNNKILWVSRRAAAPSPLRIDAVRAGTTTHVRRVLAGVGPSYVDLPQPGCWHLDLRWSGYRDSMDLVYVRP